MLRNLMIDLFGSYTPVVYTDANDIDIIPDGLSGVDFLWLGGFLLFALTLFCVFKLIGGIMKK